MWWDIASWFIGITLLASKIEIFIWTLHLLESYGQQNLYVEFIKVETEVNNRHYFLQKRETSKREFYLSTGYGTVTVEWKWKSLKVGLDTGNHRY